MKERSEDVLILAWIFFTHPDSSTTGAWSNPFSLRILMVF